MYLYIIKCEDHSLYTGVAVSVTDRLIQHYYRLPSCARYTRSHQMETLVALWKFDDKRSAMRLEYRIKRLSRTSKLKLVETPSEITGLMDDIQSSGVSVMAKEEIDDIMNKVRNSNAR